MATLIRRKGLTEPSRRGNPEHWLPAGHYDPEFVSAVDAELAQLSQLRSNWDGYGAPPIDQEVIAASRTFIKGLPENFAPRPRVVPMSSGNLQLEWHRGGKILELEFETPRVIRFLQWNEPEGMAEEDEFPVTDIETAVDLIQWFMIGTCL